MGFSSQQMPVECSAGSDSGEGRLEREGMEPALCLWPKIPTGLPTAADVLGIVSSHSSPSLSLLQEWMLFD